MHKSTQAERSAGWQAGGSRQAGTRHVTNVLEETLRAAGGSPPGAILERVSSSQPAGKAEGAVQTTHVACGMRQNGSDEPPQPVGTMIVKYSAVPACSQRNKVEAPAAIAAALLTAGLLLHLTSGRSCCWLPLLTPREAPAPGTTESSVGSPNLRRLPPVLQQQVLDDLAPWRASGVSLEMVEQAYCNSHEDGFRLQVWMQGPSLSVSTAGTSTSRTRSRARWPLPSPPLPTWRRPSNGSLHVAGLTSAWGHPEPGHAAHAVLSQPPEGSPRPRLGARAAGHVSWPLADV